MSQKPTSALARGISLTFLILPFATVAAGLQINSTIAGLGADALIDGAEPGAINVVVQPPYGAESTIEAMIAEGGSASVALPGSTLQLAGTYLASVLQNGEQIGETSFTVDPDSLDATNSTIQADRSSIEADGWDEAIVAVILRDQYGNPLVGRPVKLVSNRAEDTVSPLTDQTDAQGEQSFAISTQTPGQVSVRAIDLLSGTVLPEDLMIQAGGSMVASQNYYGGSLDYADYGYTQQPSYGANLMGGQQFYRPQSTLGGTYQMQYPMNSGMSQMIGTVAGRPLYAQLANSFGVVDHFRVEIAPQTEVQQFVDVTIVALDRNGNVVEDYVGTVTLATTDETALGPDFDITFLGRDLGVKKLSLALRFGSPGEHIVKAFDTMSPQIEGAASIRVGGDGGIAPSNFNITVTKPTEGSYVSAGEVMVEGIGPRYANLEVTGGQRDVTGSTDADGAFAISVPLDPSVKDQTLRVRNVNGTYDSGNIRFKLDATKPTIDSLTFKPQRPAIGDDVEALAIVRDDHQVAQSLTLTIGGKEYSLRREASGSGTYKAIFTPETAGVLEAILKAPDMAGNIAERTYTLEVKPQGLPTVESLVAVADAKTIRLEWEPIEDREIDGYRIYIGESADNLSHTQDTGSTAPRATLSGLRPGATYYFAVTALFDGFESEQKSNVVSSTAEGINLTIRPGNGEITLTWTRTLEGDSLNSYELLYGVAPESLTEKRLIHGSQTTYTQRDLINDVTYYLELTPIDVTGERLSHLTVDGQGTPVGSGYVISPNDTPNPPFPVDTTPGGWVNPNVDNTHGGAPNIPVDPCEGKGKGTGKGKGDCDMIDVGFAGFAWVIGFAVILCAGYLAWQQRRSAAFLQAMQRQYHRS